jgi:hypothetical protein
MQSVKDPQVSIKGSEMELSSKSSGDLFAAALSILFERHKEKIKKREGHKTPFINVFDRAHVQTLRCVCRSTKLVIDNFISKLHCCGDMEQPDHFLTALLQVSFVTNIKELELLH